DPSPPCVSPARAASGQCHRGTCAPAPAARSAQPPGSRPETSLEPDPQPAQGFAHAGERSRRAARESAQTAPPRQGATRAGTRALGLHRWSLLGVTLSLPVMSEVRGKFPGLREKRLPKSPESPELPKLPEIEEGLDLGRRDGVAGERTNFQSTK